MSSHVWLLAAGGYAAAHAAVGWLLRDHPSALLIFGNLALIIPHVLVAGVILARRRRWSGCQGLFWVTFALGSVTWTLGQLGWAFHEIVWKVPLPWIQWHTVLNLAGSLAPLLALVALIDARGYDLIFCDARMPRMGGPEFYEALGARHPHLQRACVFISGDTVAGEVAAIARRQGVPRLAKPFTIAELDALLLAAAATASRSDTQCAPAPAWTPAHPA
jgi:CheY-like chemotaxis protein